MEQTEKLGGGGGHVPPVPPWFLRLCIRLAISKLHSVRGGGIDL